MTTIKERVQQLKDDLSNFADNFDAEVKSDENKFNAVLTPYLTGFYYPMLIQLTAECEAIGHVNIETITRDDEYQTRYYICDNCGKQMELGSAPQ